MPRDPLPDPEKAIAPLFNGEGLHYPNHDPHGDSQYGDILSQRDTKHTGLKTADSSTSTLSLGTKALKNYCSASTLIEETRTEEKAKRKAKDLISDWLKPSVDKRQRDKPPSRNLKDLISDWWLWELGALLCSFISFITLIAILRHYEGRPLPRWPLHITINAVISVCSMIMKGAMIVPVAAGIGQLKWIWIRNRRNTVDGMEIFDEASRGPLGSVGLLASRCGRGLAALGALITIMAIAVDPFFQQIVDYPLKSVPDVHNGTQQAMLSRALRYEEVGPYGPDEVLTPEIAMQKAIYGSLFSGATGMAATCSSGNCTWDSFTTLGMCNKCQDVSHLITQSTVPNPAHEIQRVPELNMKITTKYQLPNGLNVTIPEFVDSLGGYFPAIVASNGSAVLTSIPPTPWTIANLSIMSSHSAFECSVYWCLKTYNSSMTHGALTETLLPNTNTHTTFDLYNGTKDPTNTCATDHQSINVFKDEVPKIGQPVYVYAPNNSPITNCITHLYSPTAGAFTFSEATHTVLQTFLQPLLTGNLTWQGLLSFAPSTATMQTFIKYGPMGEGEWSSDSVVINNATRAFARDTSLADVPGMMDNLTESMTARMRQAAPEQANTTVTGTVFETEAVVQVHWAWLALPILLLGGTMAFLAAVVGVSRRAGMPGWKSSVVALLFHGLDREYTGKVAGVGKMSEMGRVARELEVRLEKKDGGWKLR